MNPLFTISMGQFNDRENEKWYHLITFTSDATKKSQKAIRVNERISVSSKRYNAFMILIPIFFFVLALLWESRN